MELLEFATTDEIALRRILSNLGWTDAQQVGQIEAVRSLAGDEAGFVAVASDDEGLVAYVSAQFYKWNGLVQIHGLAVALHRRREGIASRMVAATEEFARNRGSRGIYVDTPIDNDVARTFYSRCGFSEAYVMPRFYSDRVDGVTLTKFFT